MAQTPEGTTAKFGRIADVILVDNTQAKFGAADEYFAIRVQFADKKEETLLFTQRELDIAIERAHKNLEDLPKPDSIVDRIRDLAD